MDIILDKIWVLLYDMNPLNFVYKLIPENKWLPRDNCTVTEQLNREKKKGESFPTGYFLADNIWSPKVRTQTYVSADDIPYNSSLLPTPGLLIYLRAFDPTEIHVTRPRSSDDGISAFTNYLGPVISTYALKLQEEGKSIMRLGMKGFTDEVLCSKGCQK